MVDWKEAVYWGAVGAPENAAAAKHQARPELMEASELRCWETTGRGRLSLWSDQLLRMAIVKCVCGGSASGAKGTAMKTSRGHFRRQPCGPSRHGSHGARGLGRVAERCHCGECV